MCLQICVCTLQVGEGKCVRTAFYHVDFLLVLGQILNELTVVDTWLVDTAVWDMDVVFVVCGMTILEVIK